MNKNTPDLYSDEKEFLLKSGLDLSKVTKLHKGISNNDYLIEDNYLFKSPYDCKFIGLDEGQIELQKQANKHFISPEVLSYDIKKGFILTKYIKGYKPIDISHITYPQIKSLVWTLKSLHSLNRGNLKEMDYQAALDHFRLMTPPKQRLYFKNIEYSPLLKSNQEITHFDLIKDNILVDSSNKIQLIDYELAIFAPKYFDLISLFYENDFPKEAKGIFIDEYFKDNLIEKDDFLESEKTLHQIADLYWYHWARARGQIKDNAKKEIYQKIAEEKKESLFNSLKED